MEIALHLTKAVVTQAPAVLEVVMLEEWVAATTDASNPNVPNGMLTCCPLVYPKEKSLVGSSPIAVPLQTGFSQV